ncbi:hypothetical protein OH76DRAFT_1444939 [Lentinus brumalis]|uniref:F-box domain-containing protein n=1 Tax=Lentinus brumalis TaxID=2498619 RepID=A0A371CY00_9APHY|nr:hypothetical protein OH76DRAFT_1444939 [Polyporus brumalis]
MTETIPNELLEAILFHALTIPTAVFEAWRTHRTFCGSPRSGVSSLLLVSKRWHTLGTSPLYESAILRTSTQVQAFAQTLTDRKDKQRTPGRYLRRLRIEEGFGGAAINVLTAAPGITTLYLGTLKKVSLKHLLLDSVDGGLLSTTMGINLSKAVAGALPHWKQLKRIDTSPRFIFLPEMLPALTKAPALEVITMSNYTMTVNIDGNILAALGKNASVKVIQIRHLDTFTPIKLLQHVDHFAKTRLYVGLGKDMVKLTDFPEMEPVKENPSPLPELPDRIWDRILDYATHVDNREMDDTLFRLSRPSMNRTRIAILLLNKRFGRLGLRHMYSIPHLAREYNVDAFITVIEDNHNLSRLVRVLYLPEAIAFDQRKYIVAPLTNLEKVSKHFLVFPDMAQFVQEGETLSLQHASQWLGEGLIDSTFFKPFASLRILALYDRYGTITEEIPRDAFPKLESLDVWGWDLIDKFTPAE